MDYGMGAAISQGLAAGLNDRRQAQIQAAQQAREVRDEARLVEDKGMKKNEYELRMEELTGKIAKMESDKTKADFYSAWDGKSVVSLNNLIDTNEQARSVFGVQNIEFFPMAPTERQTQQSRGMKSPYLGTEVMPDGTINNIVFDMHEKQLNSGYIKYAKDNEIKMKEQQLRIDTIKYKSELLKNPPKEPKTRDSRGSAEKLIATYDREIPKASKEARTSFVNKVLESSVYGKAELREEKSLNELYQSQLEAIDLVGGTKYTIEKALKLENTIISNLDPTKKTGIKEDLKAMKANHKMIVSIDRILKEAESGETKVDKDAIANAKTYMSKIFGKDTPQALKNVDFNTASGMLLAGFMKDISGTAVGVEEARRLANIFQGGDLADETFVKQAMRKFASESREANEILKGNNKHYAPESVTRLTTYGKEVKQEIKEDLGYEKTATNPTTGEKMGFRNGSWEPIGGTE